MSGAVRRLEDTRRQKEIRTEWSNHHLVYADDNLLSENINVTMP
jgi:hypothetical protein